MLPKGVFQITDRREVHDLVLFQKKLKEAHTVFLKRRGPKHRVLKSQSPEKLDQLLPGIL
jgi:hypothetical protein